MTISIDHEDLDAIYERHKNTSFKGGKPVKDIPLLKAFQEQHGILIRIPPPTLKRLQDKAVASGRDYQSMIDEALEEYLAAQ